jgi:hypothetical protein
VANFKLRVIGPCPEAGTGMTADVRERFCASCGLTVHNLSAMTETEARRLVARSDGRLCVYYVARRDGTIVSRPRGGWVGRAARALATLALAVAFWTGVVLLQRPWKALARRVAGVRPFSPAPKVDVREPPPVVNLDPRDYLLDLTAYGGVAAINWAERLPIPRKLPQQK